VFPPIPEAQHPEQQCWVIEPDVIEQIWCCPSNFQKWYSNNS